jgi:hypothetical protein
MEASCMFYLIAPPVMKLGFCIMVALQVLLVGIMKRHEIGQVLKGLFNLEKRPVYMFYLGKL